MGAGEIERLKHLLKRPENKTCADCNTKQPRWASINLGCFICIRCSGIHRSIGVHVSKVRSVTLDDWQSAWVDNMEKWGNKKVNQLYESRLGNARKPDGTVSDRDLEHYIRMKYEHKAFMAKDSGRKSKTEQVSSEEEIESEEESGSGSDESDTSEVEEISPPPKTSINTKPSKAKEPQSSRPKPTTNKTNHDLTRKFEKVSVGSGIESFAEFSQAPAMNPISSAMNPRNTNSGHNSNDFGQFSDFFGADSKPSNTASASNDKDFIMSLFQSGPANPAEPATVFASGPGPSGPYMQSSANLPYSQSIPQSMPYVQQGITGMPIGSAAAAGAVPSSLFHPSSNVPMTSYTASSSGYASSSNGPMPHGFGQISAEMMSSYPQPMMTNSATAYGHQHTSPATNPYGQAPQQAPWSQQNPYQ